MKGLTLLFSITDETPILYLDGSKKPAGGRLVNNCCFPSTVSRSYAPEGKALASVSIVGVPALSDEALELKVRTELQDWFGKREGTALGLSQIRSLPCVPILVLRRAHYLCRLGSP